MKKIFVYLSIATLAFFAPQAMAQHHHHGGGHYRHGGDDGFFMGALWGALSASTLLDHDDPYQIELARDIADDAATFISMGEKSALLTQFINGYRSESAETLSDQQVALRYLSEVEDFLKNN